MSSVGVGVGCYIVRVEDDIEMILMGRRKGSHGAGTWSVPGGHIEFGERTIETAYRELEEETGLPREAVDFVPGPYVETLFKQEKKHYITLSFHGIIKPNTDQRLLHCDQMLKEPEKCEEWRWVTRNSLNNYSLFLPVKHLIETGFDIFYRTNEL